MSDADEFERRMKAYAAVRESAPGPLPGPPVYDDYEDGYSAGYAQAIEDAAKLYEERWYREGGMNMAAAIRALAEPDVTR